MTTDEIIDLAHKAGNPAITRYGLAVVTIKWMENFAALVAAAEREAVMDEWSVCVQSDLENGVRWLNEQAAKKWQESYPAMAGFAGKIYARGETK